MVPSDTIVSAALTQLRFWRQENLKGRRGGVALLTVA
jgi:hypothetical protein